MTNKRMELKQKLEKLVGKGEDWTYDQALDELVDFITQYHQDMMSEVVEELEKLKTDDEVTVVGKYAIPHSCKEWQSALTEAITIIKTLTRE